MLEYHSRISGLPLRHIFRNTEPSFEQLARLCEVSRRQLSYWIKSGFVPSPEEDLFSTIERASLIRVRLEQGDTFRQALQRVDAYHNQYQETMRRLEQMSDQERAQQMAKELEELQTQVRKVREVLTEDSAAPFALQELMSVLRNLALNELLTVLPHSRPTPDLIMRLQQSAAHLALLLRGSGTGNHRDSQSS